MTLHDARSIVSDCIIEAAASEEAALRLKANAAYFEGAVSSLIQAVSAADPRGTDSRAAAEAVESWVASFVLPDSKGI